MKMAPLYFAMTQTKGIDPVIVHTGQHYDYIMSQAFFEDLKLPEPRHYLEVGSGTHAEQTGKVMIEFEKVLVEEKPDLVVVFGDVNSTVACSLTAKKLQIPVAHVEAGLRSFDETMPEEINRRVTDAISDLLFTPSTDGDENLKCEGADHDRVHCVGNIMIDSVVTILGRISPEQEAETLRRLNLQQGNYVLVTLHRPSNVDAADSLKEILAYLNRLAERVTVVFPMHPRTMKNIERFRIDTTFNEGFRIIEPVRYREFITLQKNSRFVLTDSGGIQEETTYLKLPCLTLRPNTERPITITQGTNELVDVSNVAEKADRILAGDWKDGTVPPLWDGKTAQRIVEAILQFEKARS
ncbi:MAG: UDP-N-acetylglucosamine 2-epimerase (non-hydrolyzing) [Phycisphaerales bacterium]|nr:MAG: UDP-N-acetylglucosamine 2-epimerase (non-hydrolyzing) [Phycisphaerales bacterium]